MRQSLTLAVFLAALVAGWGGLSAQWSLAAESGQAVSSQAQGAQAPASQAPSGQNEAQPQAKDSADIREAEAAPASPQPASEPGEASNAEEQLWKDRTQDLANLASEAGKTLASSQASGTAFNQQLDSIQTKFNQLQRIYGISRGHPSEQEDILSQMLALRRQITGNIEPLEATLAGISQRLEEVKSIKSAMESQEDPGDALMAEYLKSLKMAQDQLETARSGLEAILVPGQDAYKSLESSIEVIEKDLPQTWREYYLSNAGTAGIARTWQELGKWVMSLKSRSIFIYPQTADDWSTAAIRFVITGAIMILVASLVLRAKPAGGSALHDTVSHIIKGPWIWMTAGASLLSAASSHFGGSFFIFKLPGILLLIHGLSTLSWRLRIISKPELSDTPSPLSRLNKPAAVAIALLFADIPVGALTVLWAISLFVFLHSLRRKERAGDSYKLLTLAERVSYGNTILFALLSLFITVCGFARLAVLVFMALYALVNIMILGSALVALAARGCQLVFDPEANPIKHAVIKALAIPISFLASLISALPWLWAVPGSNNLLAGLMSQGYTIGDASFDFSRIVLIIMIFFLFRSLKGLVSTSLEHLPDTLPNIEKGGIPPLKALSTYFLWLVFALLSLMMVGVNFSSLAVVVGGLSVGVGLGMQSLIGNLTSGLILIFGRTLLVNDWVDVGSVSGRVVSIDIRCTVLETSEMARVYVPNSVIMGSQFTNWTRNNRQCRKKLLFSVVYGTDVELAMGLLLKVAGADPDVARVPPPAATISSLSETAVVLTLAITIRDTDLEISTKSRVMKEAYRLFNENAIVFYTRNVKMSLDGKTLSVTA